MREIKFRAWVKNIQKMEMVCELNFDENNAYTYIEESAATYRSLNNLILMQFTEILDDDGKDIYDGDIIQMTEEAIIRPNEKLVIEYWFGVPKAHPVNDRFYCISDIHDLCRDGLTKSQPRHGAAGNIIGNIYENPELLK